MKVALLFFGRIGKCKENYKNTISAFGENIDVFLSTDPDLKEDITEFIQLYKPVYYCNEPIVSNINYSHYSSKGHCCNPHNMGRHLVNKMRVQQMFIAYIKKTNIKYDYVICTRVDNYYMNVFDYNIISDNTKLYIPCGNDYFGINDQICIGSPEIIIKYLNVYANSKILLENGCPSHPESLHMRNIEFEKIDVVRFDFSYQIVR